MRTRNVRTGTRSVQVLLSRTEIKAIFAAINTAEMVTAGVIADPYTGVIPVIEKLERASGIDRCSVEEWTLTEDGESLPTVRHARRMLGELA